VVRYLDPEDHPELGEERRGGALFRSAAYFFVIKEGDELRDRSSLACSIIIIGVEELDEDPLRPLIVLGIGGAYFA